MKKAILIGVISLNLCNLCSSQDIHFSQFDRTPLIINPALTGMFNGQHRVLINYKDQWKSFGAPYKTYALSYDFGLFKKKWKKSYLGAGFYVYNDKAGDAGLSTIQLNLSLSGIVPLNKNHRISGGLQGGFAQRSVDYSEVKTDNQFVNGEYDSAMPVGEANDFNKTAFGDFTAGVSWNFLKNETNITTNDKINANVGIAVFHVNKPKQEFYSLVNEKLYSKLVIHGSTYFGLKNTNIALLPSILVLSQGPSKEINFGTMIRYRLTEASKYTGFLKESAIYLGCYYRAGDAIIPALMYELSNFALGISYDINTSGLKTATSGMGGIEISFRYINPNPFKRYESQTLY
ncbi:MAG: PorP/SprF family type IX secretion system membrane protein [Bacteroidota bacterium]